MKQGTKFLLLWLFSAIILSTLFVNSKPPGGVSWPYYLLVASIPVGALIYARFLGNASTVSVYGFVAGWYFAKPVVDEALIPVRGAPTVEDAITHGLLLAFAMALVCYISFALGRRFFSSINSPKARRSLLRPHA